MQGVFKKIFEHFVNFPIGLEVLRIPLIPRIGERRFRKVFLKKTQKNF